MTAVDPARPDAVGPGHVPVLLDEVLEALAPRPGDHVVDGTFGGGGYARAFLAAGARVTAFDRDPRAIAAGAGLARAAGGALSLVAASFAEMAERLGVAAADAVALDLGYSSTQLEDASYGLSFQRDGPLDMRLGGEGPTAADFLNSAPEAAIADILWRYGEERASRRIARAIVAARPLTTTSDLVAAIRRAIGPRRPDMPRDPATRSFQAVRIHVNDELGELERGLDAAEAVLRPGGRLAVVSFHSLEDRLVKRFLVERSGGVARPSRHFPEAFPGRAPSFERPAGAVRPGAAELSRNPRARSATLRVARRTAAPGWAAARRATMREAG